MKMIDSFGYGTARASSLDVLPMPGTAKPTLGRWHWHYRALVKLRERLLKQRAELAEAILEPLETFSLDMADAATDRFDHDLALSILSAEQDTLFEIAAALRRIHAGTYGFCEVTGKPISAARLRAVPWTRFCREVEEELEQQGACPSPHLGELRSVHPTVSLNIPPPSTDREQAL